MINWFSDLKERFPFIHQWIFQYGSITFRSKEELIREDDSYNEFSAFLEGAHMPVIRVEDKIGIVWEDTEPYESMEDALVDLEKYLSKWIKKPLRKAQKLSMKSFLKNGKFGSIKLGCRHAEVEKSFWKPFYYSRPYAFGYLKATEWHYMDMEFYFDIHSDELRAILVDTPDCFGNMKYIIIEPQKFGVHSFKKREILNHEQIEKVLDSYKIEYKTEEIKRNEVLKFICKSGVEINCKYNEVEKFYYPDSICIKEIGYEIPADEGGEVTLFFGDIKL